MSKIKNGGLGQYGAEPFEQRSSLEQLALKGLTCSVVFLFVFLYCTDDVFSFGGLQNYFDAFILSLCLHC